MEGSGRAAHRGASSGVLQVSSWGVDMCEEVSHAQATDTDNHLIGYLAVAEMISESSLCEYCQTTLSRHLINEDMAVHRPTNSGGHYDANRDTNKHWATRTSIATFLGHHAISASPQTHLATVADLRENPNSVPVAHSLVLYRHKWLVDPAWRERKLRGWLSRLSRPSTFRPTPVEGVPAHNVWELKLWAACAGPYGMVDLAQGRDLVGWIRLARMHLLAAESADLRGRCRCRDVEGRLFQDPRRLASYAGSSARAAEAWARHESAALEAAMDPVLVETLKRRAGRRQLLAGSLTDGLPLDLQGRATNTQLQPEARVKNGEFGQWLLELWADQGTQAELDRLKPQGLEILNRLVGELIARENELNQTHKH